MTLNEKEKHLNELDRLEECREKRGWTESEEKEYQDLIEKITEEGMKDN